jgi:hypothetical protein
MIPQRRDLQLQMSGHRPHHLTGQLQLRHIAIAAHLVLTLHIKQRVVNDQVFHRRRLRHHPRVRRPRAPTPAPVPELSEKKPVWAVVLSTLGSGRPMNTSDAGFSSI